MWTVELDGSASLIDSFMMSWLMAFKGSIRREEVGHWGVS